MVSRGTPLPKKLVHDAILESLVEIRFVSELIPEVFYGRLIDHGHWKGFTQRRLPAYDMPAQLRMIDPNMRYLPVMELIAPDSKAALRIGSCVLSYHRTAPYTGWESFQVELSKVTESLFATTQNLTVERLGLRYLNSLEPERHHISSIADLDVRLSVGGESIVANANINFTTRLSETFSCTVRIATKEFIQGVVPSNTSVFVDVDVATNEGVRTSERAVVDKWIGDAHTLEKQEFFYLFSGDAIAKLKDN